jgi:hypothetical protein
MSDIFLGGELRWLIRVSLVGVLLHLALIGEAVHRLPSCVIGSHNINDARRTLESTAPGTGFENASRLLGLHYLSLFVGSSLVLLIPDS